MIFEPYAIVIVILIVLLVWNFSKIKECVRFWILVGKLPTADGKRFFVGHTLKVISLPMDKAWMVLRDWSRKCPPVFTIYFGPAIVFVAVTGPEELEATIGSMKNLTKSRVYDFVHRWLEKGLLTSTGTKWQKRRKMLTPAFHFSILLEFVDTFNRETKNFTQDIESKYLNQPVNVTPLISDFTLLTLSETSMGIKLDLEAKEGMKYKEAIHKLGSILFRRLLDPWLWDDRIYNITSFSKMESQSVKDLHNFTNNIIHKRGENFKTFDEKFDDTFTKRKHPLLDILLNSKFKDNSIDDKGIREEVDTFMFEGHDTTAMCLNFTTMLFACHKDIQEGVYQEIISLVGTDLSNEPTYADLQGMFLLERCIKESLRLYPPVPMFGRNLSEDIPTKYGTVPKGATAFTYVLDVHRNPKYWPNPEIFDPSRHLPENSQGRHPFAFIPFSAGPRNCIGQRFAMLEMKSFFCGLLRKFILEPVDTPETLVLIEDMLLRPGNGVKVKFVLRNN